MSVNEPVFGEKSGGICAATGLSFFAGKSEVAYAFDTFQHTGHFAQFVWRTIFKPETVAHDTVDKFIGTDVTTNPLCGGRFALNEVVAFVRSQQKVSAVSGTGTDKHGRHVVAQRIGTRENNDVGGVEEISVDVVDDANRIAAENAFGRRVEVGETDDDAMNGGKVCAFTRPLEGLMSEVDDNAALEKISPKRRDGNALSDRIGGDESASSFGAVNEVGGFLEPASHEVEIAKSGNVGEDVSHVGLLRGSLKTLADKGRIADDEVNVGNNSSPVKLKSVRLVNVGVTFEREEVQIAMNDLPSFLNHLEFGNPESGLSDGNSEVVNLYAVELRDRNFDRVDEFAELNLTAEKFREYFVFKAAQA